MKKAYGLRVFSRALALLAALTLMFAASAGPCRAGMVTLVFDDGLSSVYQYAYPVLAKYGLVATTAVIADRVDSGDPDFMDEKQLKELQTAGWEIASHSLTHKRPIDIPKFIAEEKCLLLKPVAGHRPLYEAKYKYEELAGLMENGKVLRERASGKMVKNEPGSYYFDELIGEVIVHPFEAASAEKQQIVAISYEREMQASKEELEERGFKVSTYVTPHNYWTPEMSELSKRFYAQVANGGDTFNRKGSTDRYWLKRFVVHSNDPAEAIIGLIKEHAMREDGWVIFCLHGIGSDLGWEPWDAAKLGQLADFLKKKAIPVVTLDKGVKLWVEGKGKPGV
ncbi:polysaccharide deacetylase family protein [Solidesulfovibrio carbinolicus]|uniref:Polysaccharide deacetylase n=1 Tax=Solidesulfovibrio carbinolicus TaxID=296842 RepID=A0A4P6HNT7_9BACT|nr:polysaccharide deacetylase family protein [Solidesulfovibrio carbinolicus]QAZ68324.1 polysaccharide deacetylase [Solidesulfovibrio carbinolicus]